MWRLYLSPKLLPCWIWRFKHSVITFLQISSTVRRNTPAVVVGCPFQHLKFSIELVLAWNEHKNFVQSKVNLESSKLIAASSLQVATQIKYLQWTVTCNSKAECCTTIWRIMVLLLNHNSNTKLRVSQGIITTSCIPRALLRDFRAKILKLSMLKRWSYEVAANFNIGDIWHGCI